MAWRKHIPTWVIALAALSLLTAFIILFKFSKEKSIEFNKELKDNPRITNMRYHDVSKILTTECPEIKTTSRYVYIEIEINKEYLEPEGLLYVRINKKNPTEAFKKSLEGRMSDEEIAKIHSDKEGYTTMNFFNRFYHIKDGIQKLRIENQFSKGKYQLEYGYHFSIDKNKSQYTKKICNYDF